MRNLKQTGYVRKADLITEQRPPRDLDDVNSAKKMVVLWLLLSQPDSPGSPLTPSWPMGLDGNSEFPLHRSPKFSIILCPYSYIGLYKMKEDKHELKS